MGKRSHKPLSHWMASAILGSTTILSIPLVIDAAVVPTCNLTNPFECTPDLLNRLNVISRNSYTVFPDSFHERIPVRTPHTPSVIQVRETSVTLELYTTDPLSGYIIDIQNPANKAWVPLNRNGSSPFANPLGIPSIKQAPTIVVPVANLLGPIKYDVIGLLPNETYCFAVRAVGIDKRSISPRSAIVTVNTLKPHRFLVEN